MSKPCDSLYVGGSGSGRQRFPGDVIGSVAVDLNRYKAESVWCNLHIDKGNVLVVGVCYRSPTIEDDELDQLFESIKQASRNQILIMVDFNYSDIHWDTITSNISLLYP